MAHGVLAAHRLISSRPRLFSQNLDFVGAEIALSLPK
jgi:hypothetical protein